MNKKQRKNILKQFPINKPILWYRADLDMFFLSTFTPFDPEEFYIELKNSRSHIEADVFLQYLFLNEDNLYFLGEL